MTLISFEMRNMLVLKFQRTGNLQHHQRKQKKEKQDNYFLLMFLDSCLLILASLGANEQGGEDCLPPLSISVFLFSEMNPQFCPPCQPQASHRCSQSTMGMRARMALEHAGVLTRAHLPFVADTGEVITLTVLAGDLAKVTAVADALATEALAPLAADGLAFLGAALFLLRGSIVLLGALTHGAQPALVTAAHPTLKGSVTIVAAWAERLGKGLAVTVTVEGHLDCKAVLKAHRLNSERLLLLLGAATHLGLDAEAHLDRKTTFRPKWIWVTPGPEEMLCCNLPRTTKLGVRSTCPGEFLTFILSNYRVNATLAQQ